MKRETWLVRSVWKTNARILVPRAYKLIVDDKELHRIRHHNKMSAEDMDDDEIRAKITEGRVTKLIGTLSKKTTVFLHDVDVRPFFLV